MDGYTITCTPAAVKKIEEYIAKRNSPETKGIMIGLRSGGCMGFSVVMEFMDNPGDKDHIFKVGEVTSIYVDRKSIVYLNGTEVDYESGLMGHGFKFNIPQRKGGCSCGLSINF